MESLSSLFKKEHMSELVLAIVFIIYLILGLKTPEPIANLIDTLVGKVVLVLIVIYMFMHVHPVVAVLSLFVAFDLLRRASLATGLDALQKYAPSEEKKMSQFTSYNQFPYTLEQEMVAKMAPAKSSGFSLSQATYKPLMDNLYDASPVSGSTF